MPPAKPSHGDPTLAVAYLRVSTEEQHLGPEAQRATIEAWAARSGVTVVSWHLDQGVSGASPLESRPALTAALAELRPRRAGVFVVAKRDRLARDAMLAGTIDHLARREGARVVSADGIGNGDAPADQFMRTILDGAAAFELAQIRSRTKAALAVKRARGQRIGTVPWGYRAAADGVALEADAHEREITRRAAELRAHGLSFRETAKRLAEEDMVSRRGSPFRAAAVLKMLRGEKP